MIACTVGFQILTNSITSFFFKLTLGFCSIFFLGFSCSIRVFRPSVYLFVYDDQSLLYNEGVIHVITHIQIGAECTNSTRISAPKPI